MSDAVTVHLMRHGAPTLAGHFIGHTDCPATPAGIATCRSAAARLRVGAIVTSDLARARACATAAAEVLGVPLRADRRWRELDFGAWEGRTASDIDPQALARFWADPEACPPPGGETWSALLARVADALEEIGEPVLIVTHAGAMRAALAATCGFDQRRCWAFDLPYASVLSLRLWRGDEPAGQITGLRA